MTETLKIYTRKEITAWVESQTKYKFDQLKNGVLFCKILSGLYPQDFQKLKVNQKPISEYEYTHNLLNVKKVLNKHGLQLNLNINTIIGSKNNFQLANWMKNLVDGNIRNVDDYYNQSKETSTNRDKTERNCEGLASPTKKIEDSPVRIMRKMESAQKLGKSSLSKTKKLSLAKSEAFFFKNKSLPPNTQINFPKRKKRQIVQKMPQTQMVQLDLNKILPKLEDDEMQNDKNLNDMMYQRALEEGIKSFEQIIERIKIASQSNSYSSYLQYRQSIQKAIFKK